MPKKAEKKECKLCGKSYLAGNYRRHLSSSEHNRQIYLKEQAKWRKDHYGK